MKFCLKIVQILFSFIRWILSSVKCITTDKQVSAVALLFILKDEHLQIEGVASAKINLSKTKTNFMLENQVLISLVINSFQINMLDIT